MGVREREWWGRGATTFAAILSSLHFRLLSGAAGAGPLPVGPALSLPGVPQEPDRRSRCSHWLVPSWPAPLPPPPSSLPPALPGAHAQRQTSPSPAPGVTEESRARGLRRPHPPFPRGLSDSGGENESSRTLR